MDVPEAYRGREQSFLKHRVFKEYLQGWANKLFSTARRRREVRLRYIDGFAGPWENRDKDLADTSIYIGLEALEAAAKTWRERGADVSVEAAFVESNPTAHAELARFLGSRTGCVKTMHYHAEFGVVVPELKSWLGTAPALIFVDPTGWKGAGMQFIRPLVEGEPPRDVLVNVMFNHINRFKDDPRTFVREQMRNFFGLGDRDLPARLDEEELFALYRSKLKDICGVRYAADLAVPDPTASRTRFRLVIGGKNPAVLELFREIERKIIGREAAVVRDDAATRKSEAATRQLTLVAAPPATDRHSDELHDQALRSAPRSS